MALKAPGKNFADSAGLPHATQPDIREAGDHNNHRELCSNVENRRLSD
jgi:hypothetical protein